MPGKCYDTDLLIYSGTSQAQRALQALLAQYAKVDERTTAQLILFAKKYGAYLNYYDATNHIVGDWQDFMAKDVSVTIAAIADWRIKDLTPFVEHINEEVHDAVTGEDAKKYFKTLFDVVFTLASKLDASLRRLPNDVGFTNFLSVAVASNLAIPLNTLAQYYVTFRDAPLSLINEASVYIDPLTPVDAVILSGSFDVTTLSAAWKTPSLIIPQITLQSAAVKDDIEHVLTHNLFTGPLQLFLNGIISIVSKTPAYLEETLENYPSHQPHYALYLTFLRLFRFAQDHLNNFTQNHLDFYYKDVLRLKNRDAEPGFVHLVFELQKSAEQYLLKKDTSFKAGKDAANNDVFYALTNDVVLQKTTVQSLQSLYLDKSAGALYASPIANSEDGNGGKLTSADNSWVTFGNPKKISGANIGFAIASNLLYLNEGKRTVTFTFQCDSLSGITVNDLTSVFAIRFTAKKDWYTATGYVPAITGSSFTLTVALEGDVPPIVPYSQKIHNDHFNTTLPVAQALLTSYKSYQKIKGINILALTLTVSATVKSLNLQNNDGKINPAKPFKPFGDFPQKDAAFIIGSKEVFQKPLTKLTITIGWQPIDTSLAQAVADAAPQIAIGTVIPGLVLAAPDIILDTIDASVVAMPSAGISQAARSANFSSAGLSGATVSVTAQPVQQQFAASENISASVNNNVSAAIIIQPVPADLRALSAGEWSSAPLASSINLYTTPFSLSGTLDVNIPPADADFTPNSEYAIDTVSGFIQLQLKTDAFSLATYLSNLQKALQQTSVTPVYNPANSEHIKSYTANPPKLALPAPQITANAVSINYTATTVIDFSAATEVPVEGDTAYYHTEPFGLREMHPALTGDAITLLPVFNLDNGKPADNGGELWIGLKDAFPAETLSVLFQVSDGSANPLKNMTAISWYYLAANNWLPFDTLSIADETNNLTRSGIVTVTLPPDATIGNTRADADLTWIKLVAERDTDAVCKLITVRTNGAKAVFVQDLSKGIEFTQPLPAAAISKPATAIAALKKTEQPFTSFGGRLHETNDQFYVRVSERLRHKHRAVTAWDYERLVLDYFPQIHKAKCISHTGFINQDTNESKYSEVLPGHVMVVTVPDLKNAVSANLLRPYTSIGLIEEIQQYLEKLTSPFVRLHVTNPQFEEVQFDFGVTFLPNYDIAYYTNLLNEEIGQFLTPWAYQSSRDIEFGGKIEKSVVLNFVEERPYVDFVTCFQMNHFILSDTGAVAEVKYNIEEAVASTARSILVSYYNEDTLIRHLIQSPANCNCNG